MINSEIRSPPSTNLNHDTAAAKLFSVYRRIKHLPEVMSPDEIEGNFPHAKCDLKRVMISLYKHATRQNQKIEQAAWICDTAVRWVDRGNASSETSPNGTLIGCLTAQIRPGQSPRL